MQKEDSRYREYENGIYLALAEKLVIYGWIMVTLTAASPLMDSSFFETGRTGGDRFSGFASVRCSELGYWNTFAPVFDYSSIGAYTRCIQQYVDDGWIMAPSELYYPIRLKPRGENTLENLRSGGVNHIEQQNYAAGWSCGYRATSYAVCTRADGAVLPSQGEGGSQEYFDPEKDFEYKRLDFANL